MSKRVGGVLTSASLLLLLGAIAIPSATADPGANPGVSRSVKKAHGGYIATLKFGNGVTARIYSSAPATMPEPQLTKVPKSVTDSASGKTTTKSVTTFEGTFQPSYAVDKSDPRPPGADLPSSVEMLEALGVSPEEAAPFAVLDSADGSSAASGSSTANPASSPASKQVASAATAATSTVWTTDCVDFDFDGTHGHLHGCDTQYLAQANAGGDWYMADKWLASASMHDTAIFNPDELTGLLFGVSYGANNVIQNWQPINSWTTGSCTTKSVSFSYFGVTYTNSGQVCPQSEGL